MADFKIGRLRYIWRGEWTPTTAYNRDDVVKYGGSSWVCIRAHSSSTFITDQNFKFDENDTNPSPAWEKMTDGRRWTGDWGSDIHYAQGDIVRHGGALYYCIVSHTSGELFSDNLADWSVYASAIAWEGSWTADTVYSVDELVKYNGIVYRCIEEHLSNNLDNGLEIDQEKWEEAYINVQYVGYWTTGQRYRKNDLVSFGGTIWRCKEGHTSGSDSTLNFDADEHWDIEFPGNQYSGPWNEEVVYQVGDVVQYGGYIYYALRNSYNKTPGSSIYQTSDRPDPLPEWQILSKAVNLRGDWEVNQTYRTGDVVRRGGQLYIALLDTTDDGSSLDYLDAGNWELVIPGKQWRNFWAENHEYAVGDVVTFIGTAYRCTVEHISSDQNFPGDNGSGFDFWEVVLLSGPNQGLRSRGDILTYDLSRTLAGDGSTFGPTALAIGEPDKLLSINDEDSLYYRTWGNVHRFYYVAPHGVDDVSDVDRGINFFKPWKTIRYACEQVQAMGDRIPTTIKVFTGSYEEILPIVVPRNCAIVGQEVRSVTVKPAPARPELEDEYNFYDRALGRFDSIMDALIVGAPVSRTPGNSRTQNTSKTSNTTVSTELRSALSDLRNYLSFYLAGSETEPEFSGSNNPQVDILHTDTPTILENNRLFIIDELIAYVRSEFPQYALDVERYTKNINRLIDALKHDILYLGNYRTLLEGQYYKNEILGSLDQNMFHVRDATGIRNMTLAGLEGEILTPNTAAFEVFSRVTGGAYVSLDPGWGPDDEKVWITTRSCYVQNVTTFGTACVGQKIDGSLHNGGNKSIVSNDFTQVLSDGVGAYVLNGGRAELVSVFTYYCNIGYFAENGGIIRATNGNCSYGNYGAMALANDPFETPRFANVDNRSQEAIIDSAFAGEANDEILLFEFDNAGINYSQASYTVIGSGVGASLVQEEFRDDGVFNVRIINAPDSGNLGGSGFSLIGNNAQAGDPLTITIASNDQNFRENLLGLRVIIVSGTGTGQYGYVHDYDEEFKVVTVYKESNGQPGWDHVISGQPAVAALDTTSVYRFEPRPIFTEPPFSTAQKTLPFTTTWANVVYGETTKSYNSVLGSPGTGTVETQDGLFPITAEWNVVKNGREYVVTLSNAGAGYEVGQEVIISGLDIGGRAPDNNIYITITAVSNDSTNSIVSFTYDGLAPSGVFVATSSADNRAVYSRDGDNWLGTTLPESGNWNSLATGNNKFVAVARNSASAATSDDGITWTPRTMPASRQWNSLVFGDGVFVAIAENLNAGAFTNDDGQTWTSVNLPEVGDSTINEWVDIAYGKRKFVAIAKSNNVVAVGQYNELTETMSWSGHIMNFINDSTQKDWTSIAYGNGRFVAISSQGDVAYSFDGTEWLLADMPSPDDSTAMNWTNVRYAQGVFFAVCTTGGRTIGGDATTGPTSFAATSYDGVVWTVRNLVSQRSWKASAFGRPDVTTDDSTLGNSTGMWIHVASDSINVLQKTQAGARALGRCVVEAGIINKIKIWEPGSGYISEPALEIIDPNQGTPVYVQNRLGDGVLAQPAWFNRGVGYRTSSTRVTVSGNGSSDIIPVGKFCSFENLSVLPGPGAQIRFGLRTDFFTVVAIADSGLRPDGTYTATFRISPELSVDDNIQHNTEISIRERYSQCRITGHDFLDIGTGNFEETNYPILHQTGDYFSAPENEVYEIGGGRVFYTSTDQSGNFRTGELFAVEQATGIVTISADFFDLQGLSELRLGGVRLGGSGTVVREFSTDRLFTADSNNVIPTQRAIKAYLQNKLSVGGSEIATASFVAGVVRVGPDFIGNTISGPINVTAPLEFTADSGISGHMLAEMFFYKTGG